LPPLENCKNRTLSRSSFDNVTKPHGALAMKFRARQIEVFRAVMLTGSITAAAKLLFVSQPAVSRIIAHTESSLGLQLFSRKQGKLIPTAEAERLYAEVDNFYRAALQVDEFARNLAQGAAATLSIVSSPSLSRSLVIRALKEFSDLNPRVEIDYHTALLHEMPNKVLSNKVDLAVSVLPLDHPNVVSRPFAKGRMVCAVPLNHPLIEKKAVDFADLAFFPLILHSRQIAFGKLVEAMLERSGIDVACKVTILQTEDACSLVEANVGVAIVDQFTASGGHWPGLVIRPLVQEIPLTPSIVHSVFTPLSRHAQRFISILANQNAT
jgi:DNA-binding transcriptional LysR family regulator